MISESSAHPLAVYRLSTGCLLAVAVYWLWTSLSGCNLRSVHLNPCLALPCPVLSCPAMPCLPFHCLTITRQTDTYDTYILDSPTGGWSRPLAVRACQDDRSVPIHDEHSGNDTPSASACCHPKTQYVPRQKQLPAPHAHNAHHAHHASSQCPRPRRPMRLTIS